MSRWNRFARALLMLCLLVALLSGLAVPARLPAEAAPKNAAALDVIINEVAWGGTDADANDEWIELYNPTSSDISLADWTLAADDGIPNIPLSGTILAGGYFLLERDEAATDISSDLTFTGALENGGELLRLIDDTSNEIDTANIDSGGSTWPAGSGDPDYHSMERVGILADSSTAWSSNNGITINGQDALGNPLNGTPKQKNSVSYAPLMLIISEVAWAGTKASIYDEWIELHNPGTQNISLAGWRLVAEDGSPDIALSGNILAGGFYLLERGDGNTTDEAEDLIYSDAQLSDNGEALILLAPDRTEIDTANGDGGPWPAGTASGNYSTMERVVTGGVVAPDGPFAWITNIGVVKNGRDAANNEIYGTPKQSNWAFTVAPTPTSTATSTPTNTPTRTNTPTGTQATATPTSTPTLGLLINEVGWMGTVASSSDEWVEIYNPGATPVDLTGWTLRSTDGAINIALDPIGVDNTIQPGEYFVLAPTSAFTDVIIRQNISVTFDNNGKSLQLLSPLSILVDTANSDGGAWPAGIASPTYATMERRANTLDGPSSWFTFAGTPTRHDRNNNLVQGTPGLANWATTVTATPTRTLTPTRTPTKKPGVNATPVTKLVINEFLPRAGFDWNQDGTVNVYDEFIEIANFGPLDANLGNWKIDDEANEGSNPYTFPNVTLKVGQHIVVYASQSNVLLSDGGERVRLLNPNNVLMDTQTYTVVKQEDQSWCRLPDIRGSWFEDCFPTPGVANRRAGQVPAAPPGTGLEELLCLLPDTMPVDFRIAECFGFGANMWQAWYWDRLGWQGDRFVPQNGDKWETFVE